jgi:hypothetical protein
LKLRDVKRSDVEPACLEAGSGGGG